MFWFNVTYQKYIIFFKSICYYSLNCWVEHDIVIVLTVPVRFIVLETKCIFLKPTTEATTEETKEATTEATTEPSFEITCPPGEVYDCCTLLMTFYSR